MQQLAFTLLSGSHLKRSALAKGFGLHYYCLGLEKELFKAPCSGYESYWALRTPCGGKVNKVCPVFNQGRKQSGPVPIVLITQPFLPGMSKRELNREFILFCLFPCRSILRRNLSVKFKVSSRAMTYKRENNLLLQNENLPSVS